MVAINSIIFDFGGVLIDWDPDYLYRKLIPDDAERSRFLSEICSPAWNYEQDRGRPWDVAIEELCQRHPAHASLIRAFRDRWDEMLAGPITPAVDLVERLHAAGIALYGLTNWSAETFERARDRMPYLARMRDVVVSGIERIAKPDPAIFRLLLDRNGLDASSTAFVDDHEPNFVAAGNLGLHAIHHRDVAGTERALRDLGLRF